MKFKLVKKTVLYLSVFLFLLSLTQKSYCTTQEPCANLGLMSFLIGWIGIIALHIPAFVWLANPILFFSWFLFKKNPKKSIIPSIFSLLAMLSFLFVSKIIDSESGTLFKIVSYGLGYWLWVMSSFILVIGNILLSRISDE